MRVLAVGDVCYSEGSKAALRIIPELKRSKGIDLIIINGENSADGNGITPQSAEMLFAAGVLLWVCMSMSVIAALFLWHRVIS